VTSNRKHDTVVVITLCSRPDYTRRVLEALARCEDIDRFPVAMLCEPVNDEVIDLAGAFTQLPHVKAWAMVGNSRPWLTASTITTG